MTSRMHGRDGGYRYMTNLLWVGAAGLLVGLALGLMTGVVLFYYVDHRPLETRYDKLVHTLTYMKKQGFVPLFEVEQNKPYDPSSGVDET